MGPKLLYVGLRERLDGMTLVRVTAVTNIRNVVEKVSI